MIGPLLLLMFALADEPPVVGRPVDYSHVVGRFRIEAAVEPKTVAVEDPLTLRVTIRGEDVTTPPTRANLRIFPEELDFFREDVAEEDRADPAPGTWTFVWRLRPKSTDVREVPPLRLAYWSPAMRRYQATTTESVPIDVRPREAIVGTAPKEEGPLNERFLVGPEARVEVDAMSIAIGAMSSIVGIAAILLLVWGTSARPAPKSTAANEAIAELGRDADAALLRYLRTRFSLRAEEPTPAEVDRLLKRAGVSDKVRSGWADWLRNRDTGRFAPSAVRFAPDRGEARNLILRAEAETCTRR